MLSLYTEDFTCVMWRDSRLARGAFSFERYLTASHAVMQPPGNVGDSFEAWFIKRYGVTRRVGVTSHSFASLPALVVGADLVATVHTRLAKVLARTMPIVMRQPPLPITAMEQSLQWHKYRSQDPGLVWLRGLLRKAVLLMDASLAVTEIC